MTVEEFMKKYGPRYYNMPPESLPKYQEMKAALEALIIEAKQEAIGFMVGRNS